MLSIEIICVGKIKEKYLKDALEEYSKRLSKYCKLTITELPDEKIPDKLNPSLENDIKAKECNRDIALELTVPGQKATEIIIVKNENIDYKMDYYCKNYNETLELNRCKEIKILNAEIVMWDTMLLMFKNNYKN